MNELDSLIETVNIKNNSSKLLISFCNTRPHGFALGVFDFDKERLRWVDLSDLEDEIYGADGITFSKNHYWVLLQLGNNKSSLLKLNTSFKIVSYYKLKTEDAHSLIPFEDGFLITDTAHDSVNQVTILGNNLKEKTFWCIGTCQSDTLHINSITSLNGQIYVSMFGEKPEHGWKHAESGAIIRTSDNVTIHSGLKHPHTLIANKKMYYLESISGTLFEYDGVNHVPVLRVEGYARGLCMNEDYYFIGVSARRRKSRSTGITNQDVTTNDEISNSWIYRIDKKTLNVEKKRLTLFGHEVFEIQLAPQESIIDQNDTPIIHRMWKYEEECIKYEERMNLFESIFKTEIRCLTKNQKWLKIKQLLEKVVKTITDGELEYYYAYALHQNNDYEKSLQYYNKALQHGFSPFWIFYNRGSLYYTLKEYEKAEEDLMKAKQLDPNHRGLTHMLTLITKHIANNKR